MIVEKRWSDLEEIRLTIFKTQFKLPKLRVLTLMHTIKHNHVALGIAQNTLKQCNVLSIYFDTLRHCLNRNTILSLFTPRFTTVSMPEGVKQFSAIIKVWIWAFDEINGFCLGKFTFKRLKLNLAHFWKFVWTEWFCLFVWVKLEPEISCKTF